MASIKDFFRSAGHLGCDRLCMDLIGLVYRWRLGGFCEWRFLFVGHDRFLLYSVKWYVQHCFNVRRPRFSFARLRFSPARENIINRPYSIIPLLQSKAAKSRRCLITPTVVILTPSIIHTLLIMCGTTVLLPMIGLNS